MTAKNNKRNASRKRPVIAFFDYPDVFEDFYSHYGVDQQTFATRWMNTANHAFINLIQAKIGDVIWYEFSLNSEIEEARHETVGCRVKFVRSSFLHRLLWKLFYLPKMAWRWRHFYFAYATIASYLVMMSLSFLKVLRKDRPDIIFVQDYATGRFDVLILTAKILNVPLIAFHAGSPIDGHLAKTMRRRTIRLADCLIASSQNESKLLIDRYGVRRERLRVILTPIDTEVYQPIDRASACEKISLDSAKRYILFVGRLDDSVKRVSAIIRAFSSIIEKHNDVDLLIAGAGNDEKKLRRLAFAMAPRERIRFLGWIRDAEIKAEYYNAAECLVLASWREGFPTVVGEAMACGTPILSSNVGGVSELVIENETGWLFEPGNDAALTAKLDYVLSNSEIVSKMRSKARQTAESRVSADAVSADLKDCFLKVLKKQDG